jgi:hypothetical protein
MIPARKTGHARPGKARSSNRAPQDTDTYSLALLFCGSAQLQAYVEHLAGPGGLRGTRGERTAALVRTLTRAAAQPAR